MHSSDIIFRLQDVLLTALPPDPAYRAWMANWTGPFDWPGQLSFPLPCALQTYKKHHLLCIFVLALACLATLPGLASCRQHTIHPHTLKFYCFVLLVHCCGVCVCVTCHYYDVRVCVFCMIFGVCVCVLLVTVTVCVCNVGRLSVTCTEPRTSE